MKLERLVHELDTLLETASFKDYPDAFNGLQLAGPHEVEKVAFAVDACEATITQAVELSAELLVVHHGLFWGPKGPIVGPSYRRLHTAIAGNLAIYAGHLPLDAHPLVGNNATVIRRMGLEPGEMFAQAFGRAIGYTAQCDLSVAEVVERVVTAVGGTPHLIAKGPERVQRIGVVTGGAGSLIREAKAAGCDLYITGEGHHHHFFDAEELGINVVFAGHYRTETTGVKSLLYYVRQTWGLETVFIDHPTGL
jgi:dinuclear metal center YbgI/SA1388 family protein